MIGDCDRGPYTRRDANCDMVPTPEWMLIVIGVLTLEGMLIVIGVYTPGGILIVMGVLHLKGF